MSSLTLDGAGRWAEVPQLPPEVERAAARALVDFLREVEKAVLEAKAAGPEALEELHRVWDFRSFDRAWLPFILPMLGSGEVRITLHDGLARMEETGIPDSIHRYGLQNAHTVFKVHILYAPLHRFFGKAERFSVNYRSGCIFVRLYIFRVHAAYKRAYIRRVLQHGSIYAPCEHLAAFVRKRRARCGCFTQLLGIFF